MNIGQKAILIAGCILVALAIWTAPKYVVNENGTKIPLAQFPPERRAKIAAKRVVHWDVSSMTLRSISILAIGTALFLIVSRSRKIDIVNMIEDQIDIIIYEGVPNNDKQAVMWYEKEVQLDNPPAEYNLGVMYYIGRGVPQSYTDAAMWFTRAAQHGEPKAKFVLGLMYFKGYGGRLDHKRAAQWFTEAAEQEESSAQFNLALMYFNGDGVPKNLKQAANLFTKAAEQRDAKAQLNLGISYYNGFGLPQSYEKAHMWINLASSNGHEYARELLVYLEKKMSQAQIECAQASAIKWHNDISNHLNG